MRTDANPYRWSLVDPDLFYGRREAAELLVERLLAGDRFAVAGGRRMGKTTLLRWLERTLGQIGADGGLLVLPVFVDVAELYTMSSEDAYRLLGRRVAQAARALGLGDDPASALDALTSTATTDGPTICGQSGNNVWFSYHAPALGRLNVTTCGLANFDTVLTAYNPGACPLGVGSQIACNDDVPTGYGVQCEGSRQSGMTLDVVPGQVIFFRVAGYNGASGTVQLHLGPQNDSIYQAYVLPPVSYTAHFDNRLATTDGPALNNCTNNGQDDQVHGDLWWIFPATADGKLSVDTCGADFDTKLAVYQYQPWPSPPVYLACNDDACGLASSISASSSPPCTLGSTPAIGSSLGFFLLLTSAKSGSETSATLASLSLSAKPIARRPDSAGTISMGARANTG